MPGGWHRLNSTLGVARLVSFASRPAQVPADLIAALRARCGPDGLLQADGLTEGDLARSVAWIRGDTPVETNFGFNLAHMINHQTHHRGQVHAMLTAAGASPEPTDLQMLLVREA